MSAEIDDAMAATLKEMAARMLVATAFVVNNHQQRLLTPFKGFGPSKPGEYPHLRTGQGRANVTQSAFFPQQVIDDGMVIRIGEQSNAWYMVYLELQQGRLGFLKTADDLKQSVIDLVGVGTGLKFEAE